MNAFDFASTDGTLDVSPTVATLDVRGALSRLRRILSADLPPSVRFADALGRARRAPSPSASPPRGYAEECHDDGAVLTFSCGCPASSPCATWQSDAEMVVGCRP